MSVIIAIVGLVGAGMEVLAIWKRDKTRGWSHFRRWMSSSRVQCDTLMTPMTPPSKFAALSRVESELVGLPGKAFTRDATRRLWFAVHAASWQNSMVLHGRVLVEEVDGGTHVAG